MRVLPGAEEEILRARASLDCNLGQSLQPSSGNNLNAPFRRPPVGDVANQMDIVSYGGRVSWTLRRLSAPPARAPSPALTPEFRGPTPLTPKLAACPPPQRKRSRWR